VVELSLRGLHLAKQVMGGEKKKTTSSEIFRKRGSKSVTRKDQTRSERRKTACARIETEVRGDSSVSRSLKKGR